MKPTKFLPIACLFFCIASDMKAQTNSIALDSNVPDATKEKSENKQPKNIFKVNLTAIALKNYSLQYERVLNKSISFAVAYRTMPSTTIPFKNAILQAVGDDPDTKEVLETFKLSNFAITPEIRFYLSKKGFGRGFYIAPFYRYASFETNSLAFDFQNSANVESSITLSGKLTTNTGGLLFGTQKSLGKHVSLDLWFFGPHYGSGSGTFAGVSSKPLAQDEQNDLRQELEDLDIPLTNKTVIVTANGASLKLDGPWAGVRAGISLGIKF
jgi:hypothetical protein